jgi:hypothetical protein
VTGALCPLTKPVVTAVELQAAIEPHCSRGVQPGGICAYVVHRDREPAPGARRPGRGRACACACAPHPPVPTGRKLASHTSSCRSGSMFYICGIAATPERHFRSTADSRSWGDRHFLLLGATGGRNEKKLSSRPRPCRRSQKPKAPKRRNAIAFRHVAARGGISPLTFPPLDGNGERGALGRRQIRPPRSPASAFSASGTRHPPPAAPLPLWKPESSRAAWSQARQLVELEGSRT